jgi:diguanylate cyclase (GGDEF)-like protein/PAS domain S-box-containing protein
MLAHLLQRVPGPLPEVEHRLELTPSVRQVLALAAFQQEILDLGSDVHAIARSAAARARALSWADGAAVEIVNGDGSVHRAAVGTGARSRSRLAVSVPDDPWHGLISATMEVCRDTQDDPRVDPVVCRRLRTRSVVTVPLHRRKVRIGAITVTSSRPNAFDDAQMAVLQLLAGLVTSAAIGSHLIAELRQIGRKGEGTPVPSETGFRRLFFENPQAMWVLDAKTQGFLAVNDAAIAAYGYSAEEFAALTIAAIRHDPAHLAVDLGRARTGRTAFSTRHYLRDGRVIDVEVTTVALKFARRRGVLSLVHDVTERNRLDRLLRHGALRDPLTGGVNRVLFAERVAHALIRMRRRSATIAVLVMDLDHFKTVNDSMGYAAGDSLLQAAAARISAALRPGDTVARLGSDEFAVLLEDVNGTRDSRETAERLHEAFQPPLEFAGGSLVISLSMGVTTASKSTTSAGELLRNAELAMYAAKTSGRSRVEIFVPSMLAPATERLDLDQDLRHATEWGELRLLLQPIVSVEGGTIVGCEALVRWHHPTRGVVLPDTFIPLAEEIGVISEIDTWVFRAACIQVAEWRAAGLPDLFLAVNASARDLGRGELVDRVSAALLETGLPRDHLEIEVTETCAVSQPAAALHELRHLRRAGITVAIDDFGTGYSSLSKLATLPVDRLKIDRAFLRDITHEGEDSPLVAAMIALAHQLGLQVTAEGVETDHQLAFLRRNGCDLFQGYLFRPPIPPDRFEEFLRGQSDRARPPHGSHPDSGSA